MDHDDVPVGALRLLPRLLPLRRLLLTDGEEGVFGDAAAIALIEASRATVESLRFHNCKLLTKAVLRCLLRLRPPKLRTLELPLQFTKRDYRRIKKAFVGQLEEFVDHKWWQWPSWHLGDY
jgi:hypothetical protein